MIVHFLESMLGYCLVVAPIYMIIRLIYIRGIGKKWFREGILLLFVLYIVAILSQTIIPQYGAPIGYRSTNFIPFQTITEYMAELFSGTQMASIAFYNLAGNIILFIPFGVFLSLLWKTMRKMSWQLTISLAIPLFIEATQFFIGRSTDIDDVILNAVSIYAGFFVTTIILKRFQQKK
ncbi:VanZ family protein [Lysinibacillus sp. 54212]|uniref:VanZ family protein n=1 Tax=Lysinibacillus sp. 54212 TaxID=3119829 RepID=UPI002FC7AC4A